MWLFLEDYINTAEPSSARDSADDFNKIWNRVCFCVFLFVFNSLLFYWIDTIHTTINVAFAKQALSGSLDFGFITPLGRKLFYLATVLVSILVVCLLFFSVILYMVISIIFLRLFFIVLAWIGRCSHGLGRGLLG